MKFVAQGGKGMKTDTIINSVTTQHRNPVAMSVVSITSYFQNCCSSEVCDADYEGGMTTLGKMIPGFRLSVDKELYTGDDSGMAIRFWWTKFGMPKSNSPSTTCMLKKVGGKEGIATETLFAHNDVAYPIDDTPCHARGKGRDTFCLDLIQVQKNKKGEYLVKTAAKLRAPLGPVGGPGTETTEYRVSCFNWKQAVEKGSSKWGDAELVEGFKPLGSLWTTLPRDKDVYEKMKAMHNYARSMIAHSRRELEMATFKSEMYKRIQPVSIGGAIGSIPTTWMYAKPWSPATDWPMFGEEFLDYYDPGKNGSHLWISDPLARLVGAITRFVNTFVYRADYLNVGGKKCFFEMFEPTARTDLSGDCEDLNFLVQEMLEFFRDYDWRGNSALKAGPWKKAHEMIQDYVPMGCLNMATSPRKVFNVSSDNPEEWEKVFHTWHMTCVLLPKSRFPGFGRTDGPKKVYWCEAIELFYPDPLVKWGGKPGWEKVVPRTTGATEGYMGTLENYTGAGHVIGPCFGLFGRVPGDERGTTTFKVALEGSDGGGVLLSDILRDKYTITRLHTPSNVGESNMHREECLSVRAPQRVFYPCICAVTVAVDPCKCVVCSVVCPQINTSLLKPAIRGIGGMGGSHISHGRDTYVGCIDQS